MDRYTIPLMVVSMKKKGPYILSLLRAQNTFTFGCQEHVPGRHVVVGPDPTVVCIDLITNMKCALITENYRVQKSLIVLYPRKHLHKVPYEPPYLYA
jgi:hypothetical protein